MYRSPFTGSPSSRRGIILLVVLFLLTLFAIAGITFVIYADAEAQAARLARDAGSQILPDMDPELAFSYFLGELLYDAWDDETGVYSALRGHSLARGTFGLNSTVTVNPPTPTASNHDGKFTSTGNNYAFIGTGRLHYPSVFASLSLPGTPPEALDDYNLINYTYFRDDPQVAPSQRFLRDPERLGPRRNASGQFVGLRGVNQQDNRSPFIGGFNPPYTYPDLNNMFLAHVSTSEGKVLLPSFHRPWIFNPSTPLNDTNNPNWTNAAGKYLILRPRPIDMGPGFPYPDDPGGDVKNLITAPGGNDSIWIDVGAPVLTLPGGKQYKMLVAPLIIDLDGRINLNSHGNVMGPGRTHVSHQGWGPWEVNPGRVLTGGSGGNEWKNLILGSPGDRPRIWGRYGPNQIPTNVSTVVGTLSPHFYSQVDYNAARESGTADRLLLPGFGGVPLPSPFPTFPPGRYGNGLGNHAASAPERREHAREYNATLSATPTSTNDDRVFAASNMAALFRVNDMGSEALTSELLRLCPDNFVTGAERLRRLVTTHSFDRSQAGMTPYTYNLAGNHSYPLTVPGRDPLLAPIGVALPFPTVPDWRTGPPPGFDPPAAFTTSPSTEFRLNDWRAPLTYSGRIDLNRGLTAYPIANTRVHYNGRFDRRDPTPAPMPPPFVSAPDIANGWSTIRSNFTSAQSARQSFADALYRRLLTVTGVPPCARPFTPTEAELAPRRWLAQLAVNIVDYIDEDDIRTPFNFYTQADAYYPGTRQITATVIDPPFDIGALGSRDANDPTKLDPELPRYWVFGTELPRVVVNEVLVEHQPPANPTPGDRYAAKVWVELHNTMRYVPAAQPVQQVSGYPVQMQMPAMPAPLISEANFSGTTPHVPNPRATQAYAPYRVVVANKILTRPDNTPRPDNVLGIPDEIRASTNDQDFGRTAKRVDGTDQPAQAPPQVPTAVPAPYIDCQGGASDSAFFLLGPEGTDARDTILPQSSGKGRVPDATPWLKTPNLQYPVKIDADGNHVPNDQPGGVTVLLRRLANPHLPHNDQKTIKQTITQRLTVTTTVTYENITPNPWYNPYVTVDYLEANPLNDATDANLNYATRGKRQPYAARVKRTDATSLALAPDSPVAEQTLVDPPAIPDPPPKTVHTFGLTNTPEPVSGRYEWLVHLDRQLITAMELLHVSGFQPHMLTQRFITGDDTQPAEKFNHYVPWFDQDIPPADRPTQSHRLYRLFEHLQTNDRTAGGSTSGRVPGKINMNSIWDLDVFQALCDAMPSDANNPNHFNDGHVTESFDRLMRWRSPGGVPGPDDRPFWGTGAGLTPPCPQYPQGPKYPHGMNIEHTLLRSFDSVNGDLTTTRPRRLFQRDPAAANDPASHPYIQHQLLTKIFDNMTTRSNVFAVWATVGFFEVVDDSVRPAKLGPEVGRAEGRNIRHRMFAIIDRTGLGTAGPQQRFNPYNNATIVPYFSIIK